MKGYEEYFRRCQDPDCAGHYVDYGLLKDKLRQFYGRRRQLSKILRGEQGTESGGGGAGGDAGLTVDALSRLTDGDEGAGADAGGDYFLHSSDTPDGSAIVDPSDALLRLSIAERRSIGSLLETQLSSAAVFYASHLLPRVRSLVEEGDGDAAATRLLEAVAFAYTNVITFRQLLVRYDAFRRAFDGMPLNEWHLQRSAVLDVDHLVYGLFALEGVEELEGRMVEAMREQRRRRAGHRLMGAEEREDEGEDAMMSAEEFTAQVKSFAYRGQVTDHGRRGHGLSRRRRRRRLQTVGEPGSRISTCHRGRDEDRGGNARRDANCLRSHRSSSGKKSLTCCYDLVEELG